MKTSFTIFVLFCFFSASAQNVGINTTGATPHPSAALDVSATNKGFLAPRVADTNAVAAPAEGLLIYDLSVHCYKYRTNTKWTICIDGKQSTPSGGNTYSTGDPTIYANSFECNPYMTAAEYDTVVSSLTGTSRTWITQNLGSKTSPVNAGIKSKFTNGCYFKYGKGTAYAFDIPTLPYYPTWNTAEPGVNHTTPWSITEDPCRQQLGGAWRLPTSAEWTAAMNNSGGSSPSSNCVTPGADNAFNSVLKIHYGAGQVILNGTRVLGVISCSSPDASSGGFWSSDMGVLLIQVGGSPSSEDSKRGWRIWTISPDNTSGSTKNRFGPNSGYPVRCLK